MCWQATRSTVAAGVIVLDVRDVTVRFGERTVLDRVCLRVERGETVALLGPSGSGKSTLLRVIAGIVDADCGDVVLDGRAVTAVPTHRRSVGMVFQDEQLFPHLDVAGNVGFGLRVAGVAAAERRACVAELLALVGMTGFGDRRIDGLSGGERKRVALARSLAPRPDVLLLDEPLTGLDRTLHDELAIEVREILARTGVTAIWVTHDPAEAGVVASRIVRLDGNGGLRDTGGMLVDLRPEETHPLRRTVLRDGTPSDVVVFDGDELSTTFHLGYRVDGELVAISTWLARPYPDRPAEPGVQLRGMATAASHRGTGVGALLLAAGLERCARAGATLVWARARDAALAFYERHGFTTVGPGYTDLTTGLPHHDVVHDLRPPATRPD